MGTVLAMKMMVMKKSLLKILTGLSLAALVAGCGPDRRQGVGTQIVSGLVASRTGAATAQAPAEMTRANIAAMGQEVILVDHLGHGAPSLFVKGGTNGAKITWFSAAGQSMTLEGGYLIATRGLGFDLMASDANGINDLLAGRVEIATRTYEFLNGNDQIVTRTFGCAITLREPEQIEIVERSFATTRVEETCADERHIFTNAYWVDSAGTLRQMRQLISPEAGYFQVSTL
ncbi:YjbF family lipoprotein [Aestuariibius sp. HNIBRBA575]|uniref:YjbF family lipoprotein n=1 Tax=Aestuariibius sp. HNIBRBA575 TaxID=3233343 RepID=UPI0034A38C61